MDVDELLSGMAVHANRQPLNNNADGPEEHPRFAKLYKNEDKAAEQQRLRREQHMRRQSEARDKWLMRGRDIVDNATDDAHLQNAFARRRKGKGGGASSKRPKKYADMLMLSDWLIDIPGTLSTEWTMVPSPVGRRTLIVAIRGQTNLFYKNGYLAHQFDSDLPGGSALSANSLTILDCIFDKSTNNLYLLDLLWWNKGMYTDTDFTMRRFFLQSRIEELPDQSARDYHFVPLPSCACSTDEIDQFMRTEFPFELDGLLFYFNSVHYIPEQTPLVGWLKPWMLPEIIGVRVPDHFMKDVMHANAKEFVEEFNEKHHHVSSAEKQQQKEKETVVAEQQQTVGPSAEAEEEEGMDVEKGREEEVKEGGVMGEMKSE